MRDALMGVFTLFFFASIFGVLFPYKSFKRKHFALAAGGCFIMMMIVVPEPKNGQSASTAKGPAGETRQGSEKLAAKAKFAIDTRVKYTKADNPKTVALVGSRMFDRLNDLEPGAYLVAAASSACDAVSNGAVSLSASKRDAPSWFVDCKNDNRFIVSLREAEQALAQQRAGKLVETTRPQDCTSTSVAECSMSPAQKAISKAEIATYCDMVVERALIGDSDMEWSWDTQMGDDNEVTVERGFKAENAFGANLKHRYFCTLDAETKEIKRLVIEGPMGSQKLI